MLGFFCVYFAWFFKLLKILFLFEAGKQELAKSLPLVFLMGFYTYIDGKIIKYWKILIFLEAQIDSQNIYIIYIIYIMNTYTHTYI